MNRWGAANAYWLRYPEESSGLPSCVLKLSSKLGT